MELKIPVKFEQPSESTPAKIILVHVSKMESFICSLNPAASLYEDVTDEEEIRKCFNELGEYLKTKNIKLITTEDILLLKENELMKLAKDSLNYERETLKLEEEKEDNKKRKDSFKEYENYSSDEYKENVLKKFSKKNLINVILTRPTIKLKHINTDTFIESTSITFEPVGNIVFCRDQQITTKKGVVIGSSRTSQRKYEHIIMKQIFENIGANIIGDVRGEGYLEGGDFFVAREDLSMLGVGLRTDMNGAKYLMKNDLLVKKEEKKELNIDRKVYYYDNNKDIKEIESDNKNIDNKIGEYKLIKIYDSFYKFLDDMKFNYIKITHKEQKEYMINFLNIGNNTVISVNKNLEKKLKDNNINIINVQYFNCQPILNMYGGMHCMTQVSRV